MELVVYILPFFLALILLLLFKKNMVWWEYLVLIGSSLLLSMLLATFMRHDNCLDTEYLGGYITKITHYDDWDEWIHRTCTRQVPCGTDSKGNMRYRTETYDCSYRDYHPERWCYTDDVGNEHYFSSKTEFDAAMKELGYPNMVFRDMHRHYYTKDGDAQDYFWNGTALDMRSLAWKEQYINKVIGSSSVMKFDKIEPEQAKEMGLYDYPAVNSYDQNTIVGCYSPSKRELKQVKYVNSIYGRKKQFRVFILVWDSDKTISISEEQRSYWQGGNKNEFVVCLGYDNTKDSVTWCNAFSWCDDPKLEVATKRYFLDNPRMDLSGYAIWLENHIDLWQRKEFKDFDYLSIPLTSGQQMALLFITLFFNVLVAILLIGNEHRNTNIYNTSVDIDRFGRYLLSKEPQLRRIEKKYRDIKL
jgi:hypothetical protein